MRLALMFLIISLSACAIADEPDPTREALPPLAITPIILTLTYEGNCEETPFLLESWVGNALSARERLLTMWENMSPQDNIQLLLDVERLVIMRNGIASLTAPDCTIQAHAILVTIIDMTLSNFQAIYNGDAIDIPEQRIQANQRLNQLAIMLDNLLDQLQNIINNIQ